MQSARSARVKKVIAKPPQSFLTMESWSSFATDLRRGLFG